MVICIDCFEQEGTTVHKHMQQGQSYGSSPRVVGGVSCDIPSRGLMHYHSICGIKDRYS